MAKLKVAVACGGTGGHAFPGLATAAVLAARGHDVTVWTSGRAIEGAVLKGWEGPVFHSGARPLSAKNAFANLRAVWRCLREMKRQQPDILLAMGSYASLPPVLAARARRVPVILHEANTVPGRAVEWLARFAEKVAISFSVTATSLPEGKTVLTGLPVRQDIAGAARFEEVPEDAFCVFVTGGSQGAHAVNECTVKAMPVVASALAAQGRKIFVIHQTGAADESFVREAYGKAGIPARVNAFEHEMGRAFATAQVTVARAGASTCFELALVGMPAFFIPLPSAMRNHQHFNASTFVAAGAADEGNQVELTPRALANWLMAKATHPERLAEMSEKMRALATPKAAEELADLIETASAKGA